MKHRMDTIFKRIKEMAQKYLIQYVSIRFFKGAMTGFKGWFYNRLLILIFNKVIAPFMDFIKRKSTKVINRVKYKKQAKEIKEAKNDDDLSDKFSKLP